MSPAKIYGCGPAPYGPRWRLTLQEPHSRQRNIPFSRISWSAMSARFIRSRRFPRLRKILIRKMPNREEERNLDRRQNATGNWPGPARQVLTISPGVAYQSPMDQGDDGSFCASSLSEDLIAIEHTLGVEGRRQPAGESTPTVEASEVQPCAE